MPEQALSSLDIFFRIWAVVGPLLAGAASQIWERRNKVADRVFDVEKERFKFEKEVNFAKQKYLEESNNQKYLETKSCYLRFMSSTHEYVRKQSNHLSNPVDAELLAAASQANDEFIRSFQEVTLMSNPAVEASSLQFFNATLAIPKPYAAPNPEDYEEKLNEYRAARSGFNILVKNHLHELETLSPNEET